MNEYEKLNRNRAGENVQQNAPLAASGGLL